MFFYLCIENKIESTSFADITADNRKIKEVFSNQINSIINWEKIDQFISFKSKPLKNK